MNKNLREMVQNKKFILCDMDGTLMDTEPLHQKVTDLILAERGLTFPKDLNLVGIPAQRVHQILQERGLIELNFSDYKKLQLTTMKAIKEDALYPGVLSFLESCQNEGKRLALVTATEEEMAWLFLGKLKLFFDFFVFNETTYLQKPSPSPYFKAMRDLGADSAHTLILEDSPTGLAAAKSTGCQVLQKREGPVWEESFKIY